MSQKLKRIISFVVFVIVAVILVLYVKNNWNEFQQIRIFSWLDAALLFLTTPVFFLVQGLIFKVSLEPFDIRLSFKDWFGLTVLTLLGNILIPFGGFSFRVGYLKKRYNFNYSDNITTTAAIWIFNFAVFSLAGLVGLLLLYLQLKTVSYVLLAMFLAVLSGCFFIWFFPLKKIKSQGRILRFFNQVVESWRFVRSRKKLVCTLVQLTFLELVLLTMMFYFAFRAFGFFIAPWAAFLPACLSVYSFLLRVVPASLGIYEAAVVFPATVLGFDIAEGLSVAVITRLTNFFWVFVLSLIFGYILIKRKKE